MWRCAIDNKLADQNTNAHIHIHAYIYTRTQAHIAWHIAMFAFTITVWLLLRYIRYICISMLLDTIEGIYTYVYTYIYKPALRIILWNYFSFFKQNLLHARVIRYIRVYVYLYVCMCAYMCALALAHVHNVLDIFDGVCLRNAERVSKAQCGMIFPPRILRRIHLISRIYISLMLCR